MSLATNEMWSATQSQVVTLQVDYPWTGARHYDVRDDVHPLS